MEFNYEFAGARHKAKVQRIKDKLWIYCQGQTYCIDAVERKNRQKSDSQSAEEMGMVKAPMPGKITKIVALEKSQVEKGEPVIVMEAMKMEYTLKAAANGTVKRLKVKVLDQVSLGQLLMEIECEATHGKI